MYIGKENKLLEVRRILRQGVPYNDDERERSNAVTPNLDVTLLVTYYDTRVLSASPLSSRS